MPHLVTLMSQLMNPSLQVLSSSLWSNDITIDFPGAFVGCSLKGNIVTTRSQENCRFYGNPSISASDILLGSLPRPPAAATLYHALSDLFLKFERWLAGFGCQEHRRKGSLCPYVNSAHLLSLWISFPILYST